MNGSFVRSMLTAMTLAGCVQTGNNGSATQEPIPADVVLAWNDLILSVAEAEDRFLTLKGVRTAAIMHIAMHDALVAIDARYAPYRLRGEAVAAAPIPAVNEAAYTVAIAQYPDRKAAFSAERARWRDVTAGEAADSAARDIGVRAARGILEERADDGWDASPEYRWHPMAPGVYAEFRDHSGTPEGFIFGAGWATARPFTMKSPDQFRSPAPPAVDSPAYARAYNEVKEVGGRTSTLRTAEQSHLAMWWKQFIEKSHNRLARELTKRDDLDAWDAARLFALLNMSIYDGYVASFDGKFSYNHWRPYTAIRWADHDGNPDTAPDTTWTNLHDHTYAFPSYPSAHGTVCAAAAVVLADVFGEMRPFELTIREAESAGPLSETMPMHPATRSFDSFAEAAEECALSRVYLGIHFRYDSEAGTRLGRRVGEQAIREQLTRRQESDR
jgi:membrane-associated phospholipid phosphatase